MHPVTERYFALPADQQIAVQLRLCSQALRVWDEHFSLLPPQMFQLDAQAMPQALDPRLPRQAFETTMALMAAGGRDEALQAQAADVAGRFQAPMQALQAQQLRLPTSVEFAFHALRNLLASLGRQEPIDPWLIINQALSALGPSYAVALLSNAIDQISGSSKPG